MITLDSFESAGFDQFDLHASVLLGIKELGFDSPRPIQAETIPAGMEGRDVLGLAQTGTGKTAAFALPLLDRMARNPGFGPRVLILAPTRELATQITREIHALARFTHVKMVTIYGGVSAFNQVRALRQHPEFVVGCPGRVLDLLQQKKLQLNMVETLVLDEADHMFDMGFLPDIRKIMSYLPEQRQNLLFSATMPTEIRGLADRLLKDPMVVELADAAPAATIDHALVMVSERRKRDLLEHFLQLEECESAIVFTRTKHRARRLADQLSKDGHEAVGIQGNLSQSKRDEAMRGFRNRRFKVLVATDIVARGIDVSGVSHVINFDVPNTPEAYTHRIGRTGRAEMEGIACTFVTGQDHKWLRATERMIGSPIQRQEVSGFVADGDVGTGMQNRGQNVQRGAGGRGGQGRRQPGGRGDGAGQGQGFQHGHRPRNGNAPRNAESSGNDHNPRQGQRRPKVQSETVESRNHRKIPRGGARSGQGFARGISQGESFSQRNGQGGEGNVRADSRANSRTNSRPDNRPDSRPDRRPDNRPDGWADNGRDTRRGNRPDNRQVGRPHNSQDNRQDNRQAVSHQAGSNNSQAGPRGGQNGSRANQGSGQQADHRRSAPNGRRRRGRTG